MIASIFKFPINFKPRFILLMIMESIAERIQAALDYANLKWSAASLKLGLSAQAASNWKKGKLVRKP